MKNKEWELETRIKRLEGNDLQSILESYSDKIDSIVSKSISDLDCLKPKKATAKSKDIEQYNATRGSQFNAAGGESSLYYQHLSGLQGIGGLGFAGQQGSLRKSNLLIALAAEFQIGAISKEEYFSKLGDIS